jgi:hypothetical protein
VSPKGSVRNDPQLPHVFFIHHEFAKFIPQKIESVYEGATQLCSERQADLSW